MGFCFGGMLSAALACRAPGDLGAAVAYYPSGAVDVLEHDVPSTPLLVHLGDQDQRVSVADGETLAERWPEATFHRYAEAGHGFNCDLRDSFDPDAAALAWKRTLDFLGQNLADPSPTSAGHDRRDG